MTNSYTYLATAAYNLRTIEKPVQAEWPGSIDEDVALQNAKGLQFLSK